MRFANQPLRLAALFSAVALTMFGCGGDGLERSAVSGKVTLDGKPLAEGDIQFIPKGGDSRGAAWSQVVDGSYSISAADGPAPGTYTVSITPNATATAAPAASSGTTADAPGDPPAEALTAPSVAYTSSSPMEATIAPGKPSTFDFDLTTTKASRAGRR